jgi:hypothetical protein
MRRPTACSEIKILFPVCLHGLTIVRRLNICNSNYGGRKITESFVDRYKQTRGREGKTARR